MPEKTLTITLMVKVRDLDKAEQKECAEQACMKVSEIEKLSAFDFKQIPELIAEYLEKGDQTELWAGTGMFARIAGVELVASAVA